MSAWLSRRRLRRQSGRRSEQLYQQYRREWVRSKRRLFRVLDLIAVLIAVLTFAASKAWPFLGWTLGFFAGGAMALAVIARLTPPPHIENYMIGALGEQQTGSELAKLLDHQWIVLSDLLTVYEASEQLKQANFDHVVIGPPGVFVIDSKNWYGTAETIGDRLRVSKPDGNHIKYEDTLAKAIRGQASEINKLVRERTGRRVWVIGVVALWADYPQRAAEGTRMHYVHGRELVAWMLRQPGHLSHQDVVEIAASLQPGRRRAGSLKGRSEPATDLLE